MVEIVWAIDKDLKIANFVFQRCRSPKKKFAETSQFKNLFIGKNYQQLKALLSTGGDTENKATLDKAQDAPELANIVLRCALKTLLLTEMLWGEELRSCSLNSTFCGNKFKWKLNNENISL